MCKNRPMPQKMDAILQAIPYDFPVRERPYERIAGGAGISEGELISVLKEWKRKGIVRRIAAILYHRRAAYTHNAMVVWEVPEDDVDKVGRIMAGFPEVSHCYERDKGHYWQYNLFTMIHSRSREGCVDIVRRLAEKSGIERYAMFLSKREFKKTSLMVSNE